jgi:transcriptional regulator with XRE-family HTH domain
LKIGGNMKLNERIRQLRLEQNLTTKKLGKIFNLSESTISLYESGKRTPNKDLLLKMSTFFNVSTDYLLGKSDIPNVELLYNITKVKQFDVIKEIRKTLLQIKENENVMIHNKLINYEIRVFLIKSLQIIIDALYLMSNDSENNKEDTT